MRVGIDFLGDPKDLQAAIKHIEVDLNAANIPALRLARSLGEIKLPAANALETDAALGTIEAKLNSTENQAQKTKRALAEVKLIQTGLPTIKGLGGRFFQAGPGDKEITNLRVTSSSWKELADTVAVTIAKLRLWENAAKRPFSELDERMQINADLAKLAAERMEKIKYSPGQVAKNRAESKVIAEGVENIGDSAKRSARDLEQLKLSALIFGRRGGGAGFGGGGGRGGRDNFFGPDFFGKDFLLGRKGTGASTQSIGAIVPGGAKATGPALLAAVVGGIAAVAPMAPAVTSLLASIPALATAGAGALATLVISFHGLGKAIEGDKDAFDKLSPTAQKFVQSVRAMTPVFKQMQLQIQTELLPSLTAAFQHAMNPATLNMFTASLKVMAGGLGAAALQWGKFIGSADFRATMGPLLQAGAGWMVKLSEAALRFTDAMLHLGRAAIPFTNWLVDMIDRGAQLFDNWIKGAEASGQLTDAINAGKSSLILIGNLVVAFTKALFELGMALAPVGRIIDDALVAGLNQLAGWLEKNRQALVDITTGAAQAFLAFLRTVGPLVDGFFQALNKVVHVLGGWQTAFTILIGLGIANWVSGIATVIMTKLIPAEVAASIGIEGMFGPLGIVIGLVTAIYLLWLQIAGLMGDVSRSTGHHGKKLPDHNLNVEDRVTFQNYEALQAQLAHTKDAKTRAIIKKNLAAIEKDHPNFRQYYKEDLKTGAIGTPEQQAANTAAAKEDKGIGRVVPRGASQGIVGQPWVGTHNQSDWQSGNAIDIAAKPHTPVLAVESGSIVKVTIHSATKITTTSTGKRLFGSSVTLRGTDNTFFYTHLERVTVQEGDYVLRGTVIGYVAAMPGGGSHVHFATQTGNPASFTGGSVGPGKMQTPKQQAAGGNTGGTPPPFSSGKDIAGSGTSLHVSNKLDDEQKQNAQLIYDLATARGLTPEQALQLVAIAYAESKLRTNAINKKSGAFGLFQLLDPSYVKAYNALRKKGYDVATANFLAIFPDYKAYFLKHPNAPVGAAGAAVENSGEGKSFYAAGVGSLFTLVGSTSGMTKSKRPDAPASMASRRSAALAELKDMQAARALQADIAKLGVHHVTHTIGDLTLSATVGASLSKQDLALRKKIAMWEKELAHDRKRLLDRKRMTNKEVAAIREHDREIAKAIDDGTKRETARIKARADAFDAAWQDLTDRAMKQFDDETDAMLEKFDEDRSKIKTPHELLIEALQNKNVEHDLDQAIADAKQHLDDVIAGIGADTTQATLDRITEVIGRYSLAMAVDKAQAAILGGGTMNFGPQFLKDLQNAATPVPGTVNQRDIDDARRAYDDAVDAKQIYLWTPLANQEREEFDKSTGRLRKKLEADRAVLREKLSGQLEEWGTYWKGVGASAKQAYAIFDQVWFNLTGHHLPPLAGADNTSTAGSGGGPTTTGTHVPGTPITSVSSFQQATGTAASAANTGGAGATAVSGSNSGSNSGSSSTPGGSANPAGAGAKAAAGSIASVWGVNSAPPDFKNIAEGGAGFVIQADDPDGQKLRRQALAAGVSYSVQVVAAQDDTPESFAARVAAAKAQYPDASSFVLDIEQKPEKDAAWNAAAAPLAAAAAGGTKLTVSNEPNQDINYGSWANVGADFMVQAYGTNPDGSYIDFDVYDVVARVIANGVAPARVIPVIHPGQSLGRYKKDSPPGVSGRYSVYGVVPVPPTGPAATSAPSGPSGVPDVIAGMGEAVQQAYQAALTTTEPPLQVFNGPRGSGIKMMAEGGILTRPTLMIGGEHGAEAVVPLSRAKNMFGGNDPAIVEIHVGEGMEWLADYITVHAVRSAEAIGRVQGRSADARLREGRTR